MKIKVKKQPLKESALKEASFDDELDKAAAKAEAEIKNDETVEASGNGEIIENDITRALDRALKVAERMKRTGGKNYTNVLLVGGAGIGKTAITMD